MVPRPSSPTSLLWAHKLKQEHTHLLDRVKALETTSEKFETRLGAVESSNQALKGDVANIEDLTTRMARVEGDLTTLVTWKEGSDTEWKSRTEEVAEQMKELEQKVAQLEAATRKAEKHGEKRATSDQEILDRLQTLEAVNARSIDTSQRLGKKNDPIDVRVLNRRLERLEAIEARRQEDVIRNKAIIDRLTSLEAANHDLLARNQQLQGAMGAFNSRLFIPTTQATPQPDEVPSSSPQLQVACSPLAEKQARSRPLKQKTPIQAGPVQNISRSRQAAKVTPKGRHDETMAIELLQDAQIPTSATLANTPAGDRGHVEPANSRKKRKAIPPQVVRQTRSSTKAATKESATAPGSKAKEMIPPPTQGNRTPIQAEVTKETSKPLIIRSEPILKQAPSSASKSSVNIARKRKRRDIPQLEELPVFEDVAIL